MTPKTKGRRRLEQRTALVIVQGNPLRERTLAALRADRTGEEAKALLEANGFDHRLDRRTRR